jgi:hypothetical protein
MQAEKQRSGSASKTASGQALNLAEQLKQRHSKKRNQVTPDSVPGGRKVLS